MIIFVPYVEVLSVTEVDSSNALFALKFERVSIPSKSLRQHRE